MIIFYINTLPKKTLLKSIILLLILLKFNILGLINILPRCQHQLMTKTAPRCPGMAAGAVSLRKSHDIVILSFCNIVKGQANKHLFNK